MAGYRFEVNDGRDAPVKPLEPPGGGQAPVSGTAQSNSETSTAQSIGDVVTGGTQDGLTATYDAGPQHIDFVNTDKGSVAVTAHVAATDPHGDRAYADSAIAAALAAHLAATDPHPAYLTPLEADALYAEVGHLIADHGDVDLTGIADGYVLSWDAGTSTWVAAAAGGGGVTDHGALTGLGDDDHTQYHNDSRGDARYVKKQGATTTIQSGVAVSAAVWHNHTYLGSTADALSGTYSVIPLARYVTSGTDEAQGVKGKFSWCRGNSGTFNWTVVVEVNVQRAYNSTRGSMRTLSNDDAGGVGLKLIRCTIGGVEYVCLTFGTLTSGHVVYFDGVEQDDGDSNILSIVNSASISGVTDWDVTDRYGPRNTLRINQAGWVGVNADPAWPLDVPGVARVNNESDAETTLRWRQVGRRQWSAGMDSASSNFRVRDVDGSLNRFGILAGGYAFFDGEAETRLINDNAYLSFYNGANSVRAGYLQFAVGGACILNNELNTDFQLRTNGTIRMIVTNDGRVAFRNIHNTGPVAGTTDQFLASGTYTPTLFNTTNIAGSTSNTCQWIRVGNVVTVSGSISIAPTSASTASVLGISLPIASALATGNQLAGTAVRTKNTTTKLCGDIQADATNDRAVLNFFCDTDAASFSWMFHFTYVIV